MEKSEKLSLKHHLLLKFILFYSISFYSILVYFRGREVWLLKGSIVS